MVPRVARILPRKSFAHELRQQATVVDVCMCQQHAVDIGRPERERPVIQILQGLLTLEQAAIDQEAPRSGFRSDNTNR